MQHPHPEYQTEPYRHVCSSSKIRGSTVLNSYWQAVATITGSICKWAAEDAPCALTRIFHEPKF